MERVTSLQKFGLSVAASAAVLGMAGCSEWGNSSADQAAQVEGFAGLSAHTPVCLDGPERAPAVSPTDLTVLPNLGSNSYNQFDLSEGKSIGTFAYENGHMVLKAKGLTPTHERAFREAATDPFVGCLLRDHVKVVDIKTTEHGVDSAEYINDQSDPNYDHIVVTFSKAKDPAAHIISKVGSVRQVLEHEGRHALFDEWYTRAKSDTHGRVLLDNYKKAYLQEVTSVVENFRTEQGPAMVERLRSVQSYFAKHNDEGAVNAIDQLIEDFNGRDSLRYAAFQTSHDHHDLPVLLDMDAMIVAKESKLTPIGNIDITTWNKLMTPLKNAFTDYMERAYGDADEGQVVPELGNAGHPYFNADEYGVSEQVTARSCPDRVVARVNAMPSDRQKLSLKTRAAWNDVWQYFQPDLNGFNNGQSVLNQVTVVKTK